MMTIVKMTPVIMIIFFLKMIAHNVLLAQHTALLMCGLNLQI